MSMDDFMRSLSDQQKAMFLAALQDSGTPSPESVSEPTGDEDDSEWTTTMPPHIKKEFEEDEASAKAPDDFTMGQAKGRKTAVKATGKNLFMDDGAECADATTPNYKPTARRRRPAETVSVSCSVCGKSIKMQKQFVHGEYHRCSKCCGR